MHIGDRIKARREQLGITQVELARKMGYTNHTTISKVESGKNDITQSTIVKYAKALDTTPAYLMGWEEPEMDFILKLHGDDFILSYMKAPREVQESIQAYGQFMMEKWKNENRKTP